MGTHCQLSTHGLSLQNMEPCSFECRVPREYPRLPGRQALRLYGCNLTAETSLRRSRDGFENSSRLIIPNRGTSLDSIPALVSHFHVESPASGLTNRSLGCLSAHSEYRRSPEGNENYYIDFSCASPEPRASPPRDLTTPFPTTGVRNSGRPRSGRDRRESTSDFRRGAAPGAPPSLRRRHLRCRSPPRHAPRRRSRPS